MNEFEKQIAFQLHQLMDEYKIAVKDRPAFLVAAGIGMEQVARGGKMNELDAAAWIGQVISVLPILSRRSALERGDA